MQKKESVVPTSMVVEAFMRCEAGARASIRPSKAPISLGKRPRNIARSPLRAGSRWKKSCRSQKSASSPKTSRFSPSILARKSSALPWLVDDRATLHPRRIYSWCSNTLARAAAPTLLGFPRQYHPPLACPTLPKDTIHHIDVRERRTWRNRPNTT